MSDSNELSENLNNELNIIFNSSRKTDESVQYLCYYLRFLFLRKCIKRFIFPMTIIGLLCTSIYYIPIVNWNASAVGRLALIKLVLPLYHWQYLYNKRCFIEIPSMEKQTFAANDEIHNFTDDECAVCENLGNFIAQNNENLHLNIKILSFFLNSSENR